MFWPFLPLFATKSPKPDPSSFLESEETQIMSDEQKDHHHTSLQLAPYDAKEVRAAVQELFSYESFQRGLRMFLPEEMRQKILSAKEDIFDAQDAQTKLVLPFLLFIEGLSIKRFTVSGLEQLDPKQRYLFICNHRDIGLDSAFLNRALHEAGFPTTQIAIGDNLMKHRIAELIFRINKSFAVRREGSARELYQHSMRMSNYIFEQISQNQDSVWIAQREGRAKDGNDRTQIGLLKMLSLSKQGGLSTHFRELHIVPVAISYEFDPTGLVKTQEYLRKQLDPDYRKTFEEDMQHIFLGMKGQKGHIHIHFGPPLTQQLDALDQSANAKQQLETLAQLIDQTIHQHYHLHPINFVAHDLLSGQSGFKQFYREEEHQRFEAFFAEQLEQIPTEQRAAGREYLLNMYANPVKNWQDSQA